MQDKRDPPTPPEQTLASVQTDSGTQRDLTDPSPSEEVRWETEVRYGKRGYEPPPQGFSQEESEDSPPEKMQEKRPRSSIVIARAPTPPPKRKGDSFKVPVEKGGNGGKGKGRGKDGERRVRNATLVLGPPRTLRAPPRKPPRILEGLRGTLM